MKPGFSALTFDGFPRFTAVFRGTIHLSTAKDVFRIINRRASSFTVPRSSGNPKNVSIYQRVSYSPPEQKIIRSKWYGHIPRLKTLLKASAGGRGIPSGLLIAPLTTAYSDVIIEKNGKGDNMKRLGCALLVGAILIVGSCAVAVEWSDMDTETIITEIMQGQAELTAREMQAAGNELLFDQDGIKIFYMDQNEITEHGRLEVWVTIVNEGNKSILVQTWEGYVNGWEANPSCSETVDPGMKAKTRIMFNDIATIADLNDISELEMLRLKFVIMNSVFNNSSDILYEPTVDIVVPSH